MEPYKTLKLPLDYKKDKELILLTEEATAKYTEYKLLLSNMKFNSTYFIDLVRSSDNYKSTQIEGTQVSHDELYYLKYNKKPDDETKEISNLKNAIEYGWKATKENEGLNIKIINEMHAIVLDSVRGAEREPGRIRTTQNWIGREGGIKEAIFVPPVPEGISASIDDLTAYMNDKYIDTSFINAAITHAQFETIHPYLDGNGRLGRAIIPIHIAYLKDDEPIMFLSEIIELYKPTYQNTLMSYRNNRPEEFIKFFLMCIKEQCNSYIYKIRQISSIYDRDLAKAEKIVGPSIHSILPLVIKNIVFTKSEIERESNLSRTTISKKINELEELGIIEKDGTRNKKGYIYKSIHNILIGR